MTMSKPLIGITTLLDADHPLMRLAQNESYVRAVEAAGGAVVLVPLTGDEQNLRRVYSVLDGLLLPGGPDVEPARYGRPRHPRTGEGAMGLQPLLDEVEDRLIQWAISDRLPILGVCRGMQILNVALGGTLYQHIGPDADADFPALLHDGHEEAQARNYLAHPIRIEAGTNLAATLAVGEVAVNTFHHQAVAALAPSLRATAYAPDGVLEAAEWCEDDGRFVQAIQCHPEHLWGEQQWSAHLFQAFVAAAAKRAQP